VTISRTGNCENDDLVECVCVRGQVLLQAGTMRMLNVVKSSGKQVGVLKLLTPLVSRVIQIYNLRTYVYLLESVYACIVQPLPISPSRLRTIDTQTLHFL